MNFIKGRMRLFCVSNAIVSFVFAGFLSTRYFISFEGAGQNNQNDLIAADEIIPLSQYGEGEKNIIESAVDVSDIKAKIAKENEQKLAKQKASTKVVAKSVVAKKEVASSVKYIPASYNEVTGSAIVNYAMRYLGLRYVYAGRSLATGTDCSGFTSLIYKEFGVSLPKTVEGQYYRGTYVSKSNLQKGDLVFYSGGGSYPTHVAMYIGNGKVIHESNYRDGVKISPLNMMRYISARRVINATADKIVAQQKEEEAKALANAENADTQNTNVDASIVQDANVNASTTVDNNIAPDTNVNTVPPVDANVDSNVNADNSNETTNNETKLENENTTSETSNENVSQPNQEIMDVKQDEVSEEVNSNVENENTQEDVQPEVPVENKPEEPKKEEPIVVETPQVNESSEVIINNEIGQS